MLIWSFVFFVVAATAALYGYAGAEGLAAATAELVFFAFLVLGVAMLITAMVGRRPHRRVRM